MRRLIHQNVATRCIVSQPHLSKVQPTSLSHLPLEKYINVTTLDLSQCLDWIQHPSLRRLADLSALEVMPQLRVVHMRPMIDEIDLAMSDRIKVTTNVLCWANGVLPRIWDRWMYVPPANVSAMLNVKSLLKLPNLERVIFPITVRVGEDPHERISIASQLNCLTALTSGRAPVNIDELSLLNHATSLRELFLGQCTGFTDTEIEILCELRHLTALRLQGCSGMQLSTNAWNPMTRLRDLRHLGLYGRLEGENVHFWQTIDSQPQSVPISLSGGACQLIVILCCMLNIQKLTTTDRAMCLA
jgi:hypothetical protein